MNKKQSIQKRYEKYHAEIKRLEEHNQIKKRTISEKFWNEWNESTTSKGKYLGFDEVDSALEQDYLIRSKPKYVVLQNQFDDHEARTERWMWFAFFITIIVSGAISFILMKWIGSA